MLLTVSDFLKIFAGKREKAYCYELHRTIKAVYGLKRHQFVQVRHFSEYMDMPIEDVWALLGYTGPFVEKHKKTGVEPVP